MAALFNMGIKASKLAHCSEEKYHNEQKLLWMQQLFRL
jgi:hypothetical protein